MIFKLNTNNLNNFKKLKFSINEKFQSPPYKELKRHLKYDFQAKYSQLKQFQKIQIFQK